VVVSSNSYRTCHRHYFHLLSSDRTKYSILRIALSSTTSPCKASTFHSKRIASINYSIATICGREGHNAKLFKNNSCNSFFYIQRSNLLIKKLCHLLKLNAFDNIMLRDDDSDENLLNLISKLLTTAATQQQQQRNNGPSPKNVKPS